MRAKAAALITLSSTSLLLAQPPKDTLQQMSQSVGTIALFWFMLETFSVVAAWVSVISALLPEWVNRKVQAIQGQSARAFLFGLIAVVVLTVSIIVMGEVGKTAPLAKVLAVILILALLTAYSLGWVPVTWVVGRRIAATLNWERDDLLVAIVGALSLYLLVFFPVIGWAFLLYWIIVAVGTFIVKP
ncbi:MAG: hypothetical protein ACUVTP_05840 [Candidatus Fervidibacter sp.]|uniref:hypothetical protein n=1 Tax=Candidatus Fervidibacter sp. TaxID=3100871 RepID=UPI00404989A2